MRIFDCFPFYNELELLQLRLETLSGVVDRFVLVEADRTHTGEPKPLFFDENKERFAAYLDRIEHVILRDMPESEDAWARERFQRDGIWRGLAQCGPDDIVLVSDADEIARPEVVLRLSTDGRCLRILDKNPIVLVEREFYYYVNCMGDEELYGTVVARFRNMNATVNELRSLRCRLPRLRNGGWHFTFLGGVERILTKLHSVAERDKDSPENNDLQKLQDSIESGRGIIGWLVGKSFTFVRLDSSFPVGISAWIQRYPTHFRQLPEADLQTVPPRHGSFITHHFAWEWFKLRQRFNRWMNWD